jgi:hypothetical protein
VRLCAGPMIRPMHCAAIPHITAVDEGVRWLDCGEMPGHDNRVYLSDVAVRQAMSLLGYASPLEVEELERRLIEAQAEAEELAGRLEVAERALQAVDALESADFRARKRPGRPPKVPA